MEVICGSLLFSMYAGNTTQTYATGPGEKLGSTVEFYPSNEDDMYIYQVTINI